METILRKLNKIFWSIENIFNLTTILCRTKHQKKKKVISKKYFMSKQTEHVLRPSHKETHGPI
jgi:hypothetical protein